MYCILLVIYIVVSITPLFFKKHLYFDFPTHSNTFSTGCDRYILSSSSLKVGIVFYRDELIFTKKSCP